MRGLGELESVVMERLWSSDVPLTVRDVLEGLPGRKRAYTTVMTVLDNLHRKKVVSREMSGKAYQYRPSTSREAYTAALMQEVLAGSGDRTATLMHFVESLSAEESKRLGEVFERDEDRGGSAP